ncbi:MAG: NAD-dependent epimerase/dehydratase family protein [Phycisphaeraceae bacterium]
MKILLTGASSFTGSWFARELAAAGHEVTATFQRPADSYDGVRSERVSQVLACCEPMHECSFGGEAFMALLSRNRFDLFCHHAADVTDYKSPDFDVTRAVEHNTRHLREVLARLAAGGCGRVLLTGSVFEPGEGAGEGDLPAFSPYGLSKGLTAQMFRYYAGEAGMHLGKFVIPNPFGPWEEPRFTAHLMRKWFAGEPAGVRTPAYVRDNIHVSLLARAYRRFAEALPSGPGRSRLAPSGYVETQGAFAERFAKAMRPRLDLPCELDLAHQSEFPEPKVRINTDLASAADPDWDEDAAWDEMAAYYQRVHEVTAQR